MTKFFTIWLVGSFLYLSLLSCALSGTVAVGSGDLSLETNMNVVYDSNLFLRSDGEQDDFMGVFFVGGRYSQVNRSVLNLDMRLGTQVTRMADFSDEDAEDIKSSFSISYPNQLESQTFYSLSGGYNENTNADADIGRRIEANKLSFSGLVRHSVTDKVETTVSADVASIDYNKITDLDLDPISDRSSNLKSISLVSAYRYSENLSGTATVKYQELDYDQDFSVEQDGMVFALGLRGSLFPKVEGGVSLGIQSLDLSSPVTGAESYTDPFYSLNLTWAASEKTSVSIYGISEFSSTSRGDANNRDSIRVQIDEKLSDRDSVRGSVEFSKNDYRGGQPRNDDVASLSIGYFRTIFQNTTVSLSARYVDRKSSIDSRSYERILITTGITATW